MSETTATTHVALVGHCGFDGASLKRLAQFAMPGAQVVAVNRQKDLDQVAHSRTLLLINRVLDGRFDARTSLEMIQHFAAQEDAPKMMLISNYPDAQAEAEAAGALPGFGKNDMGRPEIAQRLSKLSA